MRTILRFSLLLVFAAATGCRPASVIPPGGNGPPGDPAIPGPPDGQGTLSVAGLKAMFNGAPVRLTGEWRISGAVVSDDRHGNFYHTLVVNDDTGGIEVRLDMDQIFKRFRIHSRVTVRCNGLWLGSYGGTLQLGAGPFDDYQTRPLPEVAVAEHIAVDLEHYGEVLPRPRTFRDLTAGDVSTFVAFEGVRFADEERGMGWADVAADTDTDRHLVDARGDTLVVRTSRHASFASRLLPEGVGRIEGVLGRFNDTFQLTVTDSEKFSTLRGSGY